MSGRIRDTRTNLEQSVYQAFSLALFEGGRLSPKSAKVIRFLQGRKNGPLNGFWFTRYNDTGAAVLAVPIFLFGYTSTRTNDE